MGGLSIFLIRWDVMLLTQIVELPMGIVAWARPHGTQTSRTVAVKSKGLD
jgi:Tfp pilus assembly protein PilZ